MKTSTLQLCKIWSNLLKLQLSTSGRDAQDPWHRVTVRKKDRCWAWLQICCIISFIKIYITHWKQDKP